VNGRIGRYGMRVNGEEGYCLSRSPEWKIKPLWRENRANSHESEHHRTPAWSAIPLPISPVVRGTTEPVNDLPWLCRAIVPRSFLVPSVWDCCITR